MNIRRVREALHLSTRDLAGLLAGSGWPIHQSALVKVENGGRRVSVDDLAAIAGALGVDPGLLLLAPELVTVAVHVGRDGAAP